jgi:prepilin-type N-terminal cleavage/methylation domain-containing protein
MMKQTEKARCIYMNFKRFSVKRGFTLIEMAVVLVLFGILVMFTAGMLAPVLRSDITTTQERDIEKAMNRLIQRIKMSFYDVPLYANFDWDMGKYQDNGVFTPMPSAYYNWEEGSAPLLYLNGYPVYDSNGNAFKLYSGIPKKLRYFYNKATTSGTSSLWFEFNRKVCEHTEATLTVRECLSRDNCTGDNVNVTENVAFLITTTYMDPIITYPNALNPTNCRSNGFGVCSTPGVDSTCNSAIFQDECPGGIDNKRTIEIPFEAKFNDRFTLITLGRLRDEIGCNTAQIIPRSYSPPTIGTTSDAWYVPEGYSGRVALTFTSSNGWPMYWCMEWEHEWGKIYRNVTRIDGRAVQSAPTRIAENTNSCLANNTTTTFTRPSCTKDLVTDDALPELISAGYTGTSVRGYCTSKARGGGDLDPKYISFGDSQLIHVVLANLFAAGDTTNEYTSFTNDHGPHGNTEDRVRLRARGVYHLNLYISDRPDMSKIIDQVHLNLIY